MQSTTKSPLFLDGWLEFNRVKWGIRPVRVKYSPEGSQSPTVEVVYYLNKAGKIVLPRLNPFLPIAFEPTPVQGVYKMYRQWLALAEQLVRDMRTRGVWSAIRLPPEITDIRPWQWAGFQASVRYTFYNAFPFDAQLIDPSVRRKIKQAQRANYICQRSTNMMQALACLQETGERQGFTYGLSMRDLENLREFLGDEYLRTYICYAPNGESASVRVILHYPGGRAIDWLVGTNTEHLQHGATQLLIQYVLEDLQREGASGFDFEGANIRNVATAKMNWGGQLVPWYNIDPYTMRSLARWAWYWFRFKHVDRE